MNFYFNFCSQLVENRLFTASYDGTVKVWDVSGIKPDTIFGKETTTDKDKDQMKEAEKYGGVEEVDNNQNGIQNGDAKIMIE